MFTHALVWSSYGGGCWWVTTQKDGEPWSGMPLTDFLVRHPDTIVPLDGSF